MSTNPAFYLTKTVDERDARIRQEDLLEFGDGDLTSVRADDDYRDDDVELVVLRFCFGVGVMTGAQKYKWSEDCC